MTCADDSFKMWRGYYEALKLLPTADQRDQFFMGLCDYVFEGIEPTFTDAAAQFGFMAVRESAKRSMEMAASARENGQRGGRPKGSTTSKKGQKKPTQKPTGYPTPKPTPKPTQKPDQKALSEVSEVACGSYATSNEVATPAPDAYPAPPDGGPDASSRWEDDYDPGPCPPPPPDL